MWACPREPKSGRGRAQVAEPRTGVGPKGSYARLGDSLAAARRLPRPKLCAPSPPGAHPPGLEADCATCGPRLRRLWRSRWHVTRVGLVLALDAASPPRRLWLRTNSSRLLKGSADSRRSCSTSCAAWLSSSPSVPRRRSWLTALTPASSVYHGVPMARRSISFGAPYADTIHLFRANLERVCATRAALAEQTRITVLHQTAHYFGYTEHQLRRMGLA